MIKTCYPILILILLSLYSCKKDHNKDDDIDPATLPVVEFVQNNYAATVTTLGRPNDAVAFRGHRFSLNYKETKVLMNGLNSEVISGDSTQFMAMIPDALAPGPVKITLITNGHTITISYTYTIVAPNSKITSLSTPAGMAGSKLVINGEEFSTTLASTKVTVNGVNATVDAVYRSAVFVTVPANLGPGKVTLTTHGATLTYAQDFTTTTSSFTPFSQIKNQNTRALSFDAAGNMYGISDNNVLKIAADGSTSVLASIGTSTGTRTVLGGCVADAAGNVYVSSPYNLNSRLVPEVSANSSKIYKITPSGTVSILAGSSRGAADGQGANAQFSIPTYLAIDASGNLYVNDQSIIRKITPTGAVTTLTRSVGGIIAMNVDTKTGDVYTVETVGSTSTLVFSARIRKITPNGTVSIPAITPTPDAVAGGLFPNLLLGYQSTTSITFDNTGALYVIAGPNMYKITNGMVTSVYLNPSNEAVFGAAFDAAGKLYLSTAIKLSNQFAIYKITP